MKQSAVTLSCMVALAGCHAVFGVEEFTEATDDQGTLDAGEPGDGPADDDDDDDDDVSGGGAPNDDDAGGEAGGGQSGSDGNGGTGGSGDPGGGGGEGPSGAAGEAGSGNAGEGGAPSQVPDGGTAGGAVDECAACPSDTPFCLDDRCVECEPESRDCADGSPRVCDADGNWSDLGACAAGVCIDGECAPPSCEGLPKDCGALRDQDCCSSLAVPGGTFRRERYLEPSVTLSAYRLDEFEITVGRFRRFLEARADWSPLPGDGAYPRSPDSGWDPSWPLGSATEIAEGLIGCGISPYTETPGEDENAPIACITWYEAFAFCAWDGGHLPTDAQWTFAAMGGAEQRYYPWSVPSTSTELEANHSNYTCALDTVSSDCLRDVGSFQDGSGLFGHKDLAGNVIEWVMDPYYDDETYFDCGPSQVNCLSSEGSNRAMRGGSYRGRIENAYLIGEVPEDRLTFFFADSPGARCARPALEAPMESCTPEDRDCNDATRRVCDASGQWVEIEECADGCDAGSCNECSGTELGCVDNAPATCSDGVFMPEAPCSGADSVCSDGECVAPCNGLDTCGPAGDQDCCEALPVPGGSFDRVNDDTLPATVSPFNLDRYEVTVGRFREFVNAYPGSRPAPGDGAHPLLPDSGWDAAWDDGLAATRDELVSALTSCFRNTDRELSSYTRQPGEDENRAMNCVNWYEAFAYCAWIGGRLPTFTEHNFAHVGGDEQRVYPWSVPADAELLDPTHANHAELTCPSQTIDYTPCVAQVGSSPDGAGAFGQEDLAGNLAEFTVDGSTWPPASPCEDCIQRDPDDTSRRTTGGSWLNDGYELRGDYVYGASPDTNRAIALGFRCVQP